MVVNAKNQNMMPNTFNVEIQRTRTTSPHTKRRLKTTGLVNAKTQNIIPTMSKSKTRMTNPTGSIYKPTDNSEYVLHG